MPPSTHPPFPDNVPVQDLLVVDYKLLKAGDKHEVEVLWKAATTWGFWYLKNHDVEPFVEPMFKMGSETLALPFSEKMRYWQGNKGGSFGYRVAGATYTDVDGSTDVAEFINVSKDDAMVYPRVVNKAYPTTVNACMESAVRPFIQACVDVSRVMLEIFNNKLELPDGALAERHRTETECISESRCIRVPPTSQDVKIALGPHTDFGSISFLVNRLGGLQVLVPNGGDGEWKYVKPIPAHAICNIGDALNLLSGGILKSCVHRVVPPPGKQAEHERWSLVYFTRPTNEIHLGALVDQSPLIAQSVKNANTSTYDPQMTAAQWFVKRQTQARTDADKVSTLSSTGEHI
ncbi:hypothetical protein B0H34DRAFT_784130 [Crassisporium funariophilum]|nr:hypothetical protein B0H34DRAFT_784130 [Crassisporium funariophilum]